VPHPLDGWVVADLSTGIAGAYCTKILADGGADVIKFEPSEGDPLREWSASGTAPGALFNFLAASKKSAPELSLDAADVVIWSPGGLLDPATILEESPRVTVTAITPFGLHGPWRDRAATEFTLQAWSGGMIGLGRGDPSRAPVHVGGQIGEWLAGVCAAIGTMASRRRCEPAGVGESVDVSMLEALAMCLTYYPVTFFDVIGKAFRRGRSVITPGVGQAKDGMIGVGVGTGQQWLDFCVMVGHPEWMEDKSLFRERSHLAPLIEGWFAEHTIAEIREMADAYRLPNASIANGASLPELDHFAARGSFVRHEGVVHPGPPYRMEPDLLRMPSPLAEAAAPSERRPAPVTEVDLPFAGLRVLDMTAFWAGPSCTHYLAMLGAEVIHLESVSRLDGTRMLGAPMTVEQWWERSPIFAGLNTNKQSLTVDFQSARGMDVLRRLISTVDVIVENYTPRVLDQVGLDFAGVRAIRDDVIMVRMPGFGLDGPWRDNAAFAYTIEDASGLTWMTGHADQSPLEPYGVGDANAGLHALAGLLLALEHRRQTGEGVNVEAAMVDAAINVTAEQVIEYSTSGTLLTRDGNRGPAAAPQGLYPTADGPDEWVAIAVATDAQWAALTEVVGIALDPALKRREHHDDIDDQLARWCAIRNGDDIVDMLWAVDVPVAKVMQPHEQAELPHLMERGFFEKISHPVMGDARYSTMPMRFSRGPDQIHARHAPLLGEHNAEILAGLGLTQAEIASLEKDGVIGQVPVTR
jgi:crotonobetainyl-CoA:carnitine CoA-transferase CaiB-like acyl-CoA transferase